MRIAYDYIQSRIVEDNEQQFLITNSVALLRELQRQRVIPVFVSGSACDFLGALADYLDVNHVLATNLEVSKEGKYTGKVHGRIMIGSGKAEAVSEFLKQQAVDPAVCYGIRDHPTDAWS